MGKVVMWFRVSWAPAPHTCAHTAELPLSIPERDYKEQYRTKVG